MPQEQIQHIQETSAKRLTAAGFVMLAAEVALVAGETTGYVEASGLVNVMAHTVLGVGGLGAAASGLLRLRELSGRAQS